MTSILYVEDHEDTREAVKQILLNAGFIVECAASGKEAIKKASEEYNIILLDIMLPDMSGWDIFANLSKKKPQSKFVFLSAIPVSSERMEELKKAGVSDYITKPFTKSDLLERIKKILQK
jgi:DNA-binding response OmpR family regulator